MPHRKHERHWLERAEARELALLPLRERDDPAVNEADLEARLADLEGRFAFLDDLLHQLDAVVTTQQRVIDDLREQLDQTRASLKQAGLGGADESPEPPPPHY